MWRRCTNTASICGSTRRRHRVCPQPGGGAPVFDEDPGEMKGWHHWAHKVDHARRLETRGLSAPRAIEVRAAPLTAEPLPQSEW